MFDVSKEKENPMSPYMGYRFWIGCEKNWV